jgi:CheY-like chemotaxis protein/GAF domain-containing protein
LANDAARAERRLHFLADAGVLFAADLDAEDLLRSLARLAVPDVADVCIVDAVSEGAVRRLALVHVDPPRSEGAATSGTADPDSADAVAAANIHRIPHLWKVLDDDALHAMARGPEDVEVLRGLGLISAVAVPLLAGGRALGALVLASVEGGHACDEDDLAFALTLAERAAQAVDKARHRRFQDELLAMLAHELRAPLNAIAGWAHLLRVDTVDRAAIDHAVEAIERNVALQARLLGRIEDASHAAAPRPSAVPEAPTAAPRPARGPLPSLEGVRVLLVDDEKDTREVITAVLEERGARVTAASSVAEAMGALAAEVPDVVVGDIGMPDEDGYSLMRRVRALPADRGGTVPAAALTAYARAQDRMQALLAGYHVHVPKPARPAELINVVATLAARRSTTRIP